MKEHPIIFSTDMVKAILDGRKTQTRRIIKNTCNICAECWQKAIPHNKKSSIFEDIETGQSLPYLKPVFCEHNDTTAGRVFCPYGQVGSRLWVRETWLLTGGRGSEHLAFKANGYKLFQGLFPEKWKPSIFMPRWASRIDLEITGIRVERLQEMTEEDAIKEGIAKVFFEPDETTNKALASIGAKLVTQPYPVGFENYAKKLDRRYKYFQPHDYPDFYNTAKDSFKSLWNSINTKCGHSWESNPWVWVIELKRAK